MRTAGHGRLVRVVKNGSQVADSVRFTSAGQNKIRALILFLLTFPLRAGDRRNLIASRGKRLCRSHTLLVSKAPCDCFRSRVYVPDEANGVYQNLFDYGLADELTKVDE
jgi:hypothetical protein